VRQTINDQGKVILYVLSQYDLFNTKDLQCFSMNSFLDNSDDSVWETLAQRRKIACLSALFKAYTGERAWKAVGDRLQAPGYLSRDDHHRKIRARKQRTDTGKYSFVNRTIKFWNQLPAEAVATSPVNRMILERGLGR
jgi:hypothetical protein